VNWDDAFMQTAFSGGGKRLFRDITEEMPDKKMAFLDACGNRRGRFEAQRGLSSAIRAFFAGEGDGDATALVRGLETEKDIFTRAARGDAEHDITGLRKGFDLAREDGVVAEVVAVRGEDRCR
jgi:hypothetical protein